MKINHFNLRIYAIALALVLVLFGISAPSIQAQTNYGSVRGRVTDPEGAAVSEASVLLTNSGTKVIRSTRTNDAGDFFFTAVDPGSYEVAISLAGFKNIERKGVAVDLGATVTLDEKLEVGTVGETVDVTGSAP
jgi:hypothetical protein